LPKRPTRITLLTDMLVLHSREEDNTRRSAVQTQHDKPGGVCWETVQRGVVKR
jgi:hypothetical protein